MKICTLCFVEKNYTDFSKRSKSPDGHYPQCKKCRKKEAQVYYLKNKEQKLEKAKKYYTENKDKILVPEKQQKRNEYTKVWKQENKEYVSEYNKFYRSENKEARATYKKQYKEDNREQSNKTNREWLRSNPIARLSKAVRARLREFLNNNGLKKKYKFEQYIGCDKETFVKHIESQFQPGMTWENQGDWHVDHILALSNAQNEEQLYKLCHYLNLRPMWAIDNIKKGNRSDICWQKLQRDRLNEEDKQLGFRFDLKASQFDLQRESLTSEHTSFIQRYEWLGTIGFGVRQVFTARFEGKLAGVVMIAEPNGYQFDRSLEALIQRGACSSWAPKNLNSRLVMFACKWMVENTTKRIFVAYSDPDAGEIGTIYQACNFDYLGQNYGSSEYYLLPNGKKVTDRHFTRTSSMKKWAKELNIEWRPEWTKANGFQDTSNIPTEIKEKLIEHSKSKRKDLPKVKANAKGKYVLLLKRNKREQIEKTWIPVPYPKR